ncbi:MAG: hypothetical protein ACTH93_09170 [Pseudoclavibacter sp.]
MTRTIAVALVALILVVVAAAAVGGFAYARLTTPVQTVTVWMPEGYEAVPV